jgi:hypothetical protein
MEYRHSQYGFMWLFVIVWLVVVMALVAFLGDEETDLVLIMALTGALLLLIGAITFWFSRLTIVIEDDAVTAYFGVGWPRRKIQRYEIIGFRKAHNRWWYGWGIRKVPGGWMYNVWGLDAVELELTNGRKFRLGTDEAEELAAALMAMTALRPG